MSSSLHETAAVTECRQDGNGGKNFFIIGWNLGCNIFRDQKPSSFSRGLDHDVDNFDMYFLNTVRMGCAGSLKYHVCRFGQTGGTFGGERHDLHTQTAGGFGRGNDILRIAAGRDGQQDIASLPNASTQRTKISPNEKSLPTQVM